MSQRFTEELMDCLINGEVDRVSGGGGSNPLTPTNFSLTPNLSRILYTPVTFPDNLTTLDVLFLWYNRERTPLY
ncbi:hypothetical protein [Alteromonas australica]|uniref:hypothetical protein n=1 Tax=Alteromonas australica TaxID=589873 RepID=UPI0012DE7D1D|nr:hypothetical protein [Alteromonas australica]